MCCKKDEKLTKVFQNLTGKIIGWKVYKKKIIDNKLALASISWNWIGGVNVGYDTYIGGVAVNNNEHIGGTVTKSGVIESDWATGTSNHNDFICNGIHAYLSKSDAESSASLKSNIVVVKIEIEPSDVLAVGEVWQNVTSFGAAPLRDKTIPITVVAKKVKITRSEFRKAMKENK